MSPNRCTYRKQRSYNRIVRVWGSTVSHALFLAPRAPLPFFSTGEQMFGELARFAEASSTLSYTYTTRLLRLAIAARCRLPGRHRKTYSLQLCDVKLASSWLRSGEAEQRVATTPSAVQGLSKPNAPTDVELIAGLPVSVPHAQCIPWDSISSPYDRIVLQPCLHGSNQISDPTALVSLPPVHLTSQCTLEAERVVRNERPSEGPDTGSSRSKSQQASLSGYDSVEGHLDSLMEFLREGDVDKLLEDMDLE